MELLLLKLEIITIIIMPVQLILGLLLLRIMPQLKMLVQLMTQELLVVLLLVSGIILEMLP